MRKKQIILSKYLSLVLRHSPEKIGLTLDKNGWTDIDDLIKKMQHHGKAINKETLIYIIDTDNKKRFAFDVKTNRIRANQGHSIKIDLGYVKKTPPPYLYHGTCEESLAKIYKQGIQKMKRHHVHLSSNKATALTVGARHGKPIILTIAATLMLESGYSFFQSDNGVWLVDEVPVNFIQSKNHHL